MEFEIMFTVDREMIAQKLRSRRSTTYTVDIIDIIRVYSYPTKEGQCHDIHSLR